MNKKLQKCINIIKNPQHCCKMIVYLYFNDQLLRTVIDRVTEVTVIMSRKQLANFSSKKLTLFSGIYSNFYLLSNKIIKSKLAFVLLFIFGHNCVEWHGLMHR